MTGVPTCTDAIKPKCDTITILMFSQTINRRVARREILMTKKYFRLFEQQKYKVEIEKKNLFSTIIQATGRRIL